MAIERLAGVLLAAAWPLVASGAEGIVRYGGDGTATLHTTATLEAGRPVQLQYRSPSGATRCCVRATVAAPADGGAAAVSDELGGAAVLAYTLELRAPPALDRPFAGAAVVDPAGPVRRASATALALGHGARATTVSACTSQEGLHLLTQRGSRLTAHLYLGFDHAVKPNCPPAARRLMAAPR